MTARRTIPWLVAYLVTMAALTGGLVWAREAVVESLGNPAALAEWREWKAASQRLSKEPGPVARRAAKSDEPPALILMRDNFVAILVVSLLIGSFLFAFLAFALRGSLQRRATTVDIA